MPWRLLEAVRPVSFYDGQGIAGRTRARDRKLHAPVWLRLSRHRSDALRPRRYFARERCVLTRLGGVDPFRQHRLQLIERLDEFLHAFALELIGHRTQVDACIAQGLDGAA